MKKRIKQSFFGKHYSLSWRYLKESKEYILLTVLILIGAFLIAWFFQPPVLVNMIKGFVDRVLTETEGLNLWQMFVYILNNNLKSSFFAMILGVGLGIFSIFTAIVNGYVLGFVSEKSVSVGGVSILLRLLPHGIFEFPAIVIAISLGIKLGMFVFSKDKKREFMRRFENSLRIFLFVILPLLIIAAIIESALIFVLR